MGVRRLVLFLLLYVTLDFANPLMPGAVRFDGESVDAVRVDRAHLRTARVPVVLVPVFKLAADSSPDAQSFRRKSLGYESRRFAVTRIRRAPVPSSDPPASSEDH